MKKNLLSAKSHLSTSLIMPVTAGLDEKHCKSGNLINRQLRKSAIQVILVFLLFLGFSLTGYTQQIIKLDDAISEMLSSEDPTLVEQGHHLKSLVTDLKPSVNLIGGQQVLYGQGSPVVAVCDAVSVNMLYTDDPAFNEVELIRLTASNANQLPSVIDLTQIQGFTNLKYMLVVFAYDACGGQSEQCLLPLLGGIFQGDSSPVIVLYSLSIPE